MKTDLKNGCSAISREVLDTTSNLGGLFVHEFWTIFDSSGNIITEHANQCYYEGFYRIGTAIYRTDRTLFAHLPESDPIFIPLTSEIYLLGKDIYKNDTPIHEDVHQVYHLYKREKINDKSEHVESYVVEYLNGTATYYNKNHVEIITLSMQEHLCLEIDNPELYDLILKEGEI